MVPLGEGVVVVGVVVVMMQERQKEGCVTCRVSAATVPLRAVTSRGFPRRRCLVRSLARSSSHQRSLDKC